ncbi:hypothetical protein FB45DRAFT_942117 [Roridomyces roridus]|uniref:Uncharacterized protein n=1 Tax=Roridomyces roridus TaxID=1738132 RepID=A0AAD7B531_9AGAR|nr:hypothetical protein FB45DRAFT_942117 [Roridomyces roridus]
MYSSGWRSCSMEVLSSPWCSPSRDACELRWFVIVLGLRGMLVGIRGVLVGLKGMLDIVGCRWLGRNGRGRGRINIHILGRWTRCIVWRAETCLRRTDMTTSESSSFSCSDAPLSISSDCVAGGAGFCGAARRRDEEELEPRVPVAACSCSLVVLWCA